MKTGGIGWAGFFNLSWFGPNSAEWADKLVKIWPNNQIQHTTTSSLKLNCIVRKKVDLLLTVFCAMYFSFWWKHSGRQPCFYNVSCFLDDDTSSAGSASTGCTSCSSCLLRLIVIEVQDTLTNQSIRIIQKMTPWSMKLVTAKIRYTDPCCSSGTINTRDLEDLLNSERGIKS
jgi:hypothetical protein